VSPPHRFFLLSLLSFILGEKKMAVNAEGTVALKHHGNKDRRGPTQVIQNSDGTQGAKLRRRPLFQIVRPLSPQNPYFDLTLSQSGDSVNKDFKREVEERASRQELAQAPLFLSLAQTGEVALLISLVFWIRKCSV
jgi:hypothetical protein